MITKQCELCSSDFEAKEQYATRTKYCSVSCRNRGWTRNNLLKSRDIKLRYVEANPEKVLASKRKYADENKEKHSVATEKYRRENPGYYREYASLRTRKVQAAKPKWLDEFENLWLTEIYDLAVKRGLEVDHIVPITSKIVCGLHVPWNLQLLSREENAVKSNKFDVSTY